MTRKDFEALACALAYTRPHRDNVALHAQWEAAVVAIGDACALHNPRFDRSKFYDATEA